MTFLGLPACPDLAALDADIALLGIPGATPYPGSTAFCADAPDTIRAVMGARAWTLGHHDFDLGGTLLGDPPARAVDCGNLPFDPADLPGNRVGIRAALTKILERHAVPVIIGGDDSVQIPLFEAFSQRGPYTILQVDAHIDWRDELEGERFGLSSTMRRAAELPHVENLIQVGGRGTGSARASDVADARAAGAALITAREIHHHGVAAALDLVPAGAEIMVAFDCDALDPAIMPGVSGRSPGGLTYWQVIDLLHGVAAKARIANFNLVEFMPSRDIDGLGALLAGRILANVIGLVARQR